jgi:DNA primase
LDNDSAGDKATQRIKDKLKELNKKTKILVPINKDWNEDLIMLKKGDSAKWKQEMLLE